MKLRILEDLVLLFDVLWLSAAYMVVKTVFLLLLTHPSRFYIWDWALIATTAILVLAAAVVAIVYSHVPSFWARAQLGRLVVVTMLTIVASALVSDLVSGPIAKFRGGVPLAGTDYLKMGAAAAVVAIGVAFFWYETVDFVVLLTK